MSTEVSLQQALQARVADQIRANFVALIPQDAFDKMVATALDDFINGARSKRFTKDREWIDGGYKEVEVPNPKYDPVTDPDTLPGMVMQEVKKVGKEQLVSILSSGAFATMWNNGNTIASEVVQKAIGENSQAFVTSLFSGIVQTALGHMTAQIRNMNPGHY